MSDTVASPCIDVCELDELGLCMGCLRSGDEIMAWPGLDDDGKRAVMERVTERRERSQQADAMPLPGRGPQF